MRAPGFWHRPPGVLSALLTPASLVWRALASLRRALASPRHPGVPVICVGNLTVGGAGKTPLVAALAGRLAARGRAVHVLSRGHGGRLRGPVRVDPAMHSAADVGDEPLLLAAFAPVWVARDRASGAAAAAAAGAEIVVMDDGFQNPGIVKDLSILAIDAESGIGNGCVMPAGPLREPVAAGLSRARVAVLIGPARARARTRAAIPGLDRLAVVEAAFCPVATGLDLSGLPAVAFAGIGRPAKFFATVEALGARLVAAHAFPDHHAYRDAVLRRLLREARGAGAMLLTTEKDAVRLPDWMRREVMAVPVRLEPVDWGPIDAALDGLFDACPGIAPIRTNPRHRKG